MSATPDRIAARQLEIVLQLSAEAETAVAAGEPADNFLASAFRAHREFGARDRRFYSESVFTLFRWRGALDHAGIAEPATRLRVAWLLDDRVWPAPLQATEDCSPLLALARACPVERLVPDWLPATLVDAAQVESFIHSLQQRPPTWLRCRKGRAADLQARAGKLGARATVHPRMPLALALNRALPLDQLHRETSASFEVQDIASQAVSLICDPHPGQSWLDVCAGSGGKALHLAELMDHRGTILASDVRPTALRELERRARAAGASIIRTGDAGESNFDGVLVDAPCSGIGTWARNPDMRWRTPAAGIAEKALRQLEILTNAARNVKSGGRLVYAVCTVTRAETVDVAAQFAAAHADFAPELFTNPLNGESTPGQLQLWPADGPGDGMFIARWIRK